MLYPAIRPLLFALDPEKAHAMALKALSLAGRGSSRIQATASIECMGLKFPNRVGLAAGFDKNATAVNGLGALGFGFIEVGTVTPRAQSGQPRPRVFRLASARALINRLGFPNDGAAVIADRLRNRRYQGIVGVNIGKNADTPMVRAIDDYVSCFRTVRSVCDYVVLNVSSPNTLALRELQSRERLEPLLTALLDERSRCGTNHVQNLPLLLKISPDLSTSELHEIAALLKSLPMDGIISTNTTVSRHGTLSGVRARAGGLSGSPLQGLARRTVATLRVRLGPSFPIIGVGGIDSPQAALAMRAAGADMIQLYTGLVYRGPSLISRCVRVLG